MNSLCWRENIDEVALYVKGKMSTTYAVVELDYGDGSCEGCQGQAGKKGYLGDAPILHDPLGDLKRLSMDTDLDWKVRLLDGQTIDAVQDILIGYCLKKIEAMLHKEKAPSEDWAAFNLLSEFLNVVAERDLSRLVYCLEWVTKLFLIGACDSPKEGLLACNQFCLIDESVLHYTRGETDSLWDSLFQPDESISKVVKWVPEITSEGIKSAVNEGIFHPPAFTRETKRVQFLAQRSEANLAASWAFVVDENGSETRFPEPLG